MKTPVHVIALPSSYLVLCIWFIPLIAPCFKLGPLLGAGAVSYYAHVLHLASWSHPLVGAISYHSSTNTDMLGGQGKCILQSREGCEVMWLQQHPGIWEHIVGANGVAKRLIASLSSSFVSTLDCP